MRERLLRRKELAEHMGASAESLAGLHSVSVGAEQTSTGRLAPRYGYVFTKHALCFIERNLEQLFVYSA